MKSKQSHGGVSVDHSRQLPRLRRIEGQVRGLQSMVEKDRDCKEIVNQISAVVAALRRVQGDMLRDHITACAVAATQGSVSEKEAHKLAEEVGALLSKLG